MSDVIRNVAVKVSIETTAGAAADGIKAIAASADQANSSLSRMSETIAKIITQQGQMQVGQLEADQTASQSRHGGGGATSGGGTTLPAGTDLESLFGIEMDKSAPPTGGMDMFELLQEFKRKRGSGGSGGSGSLGGSSGGASDPFALTPEEKAMTHSAGKIQKERADAKKKEETKAEDAHEKTSNANRKYTESSRAAALSAVEFAKGLALVALSGDENNESLARGIVQVQGYFNLIRGGIGTVQAFGDAMKAAQAAKSLGSAGGATATGSAVAGRAAASAATAGAETAVAGGAATAGGAAAGAVGVAVVIAAIIARELNKLAVAHDKRERESTLRHSGIISDFANQAGGRHAEQAIQIARAIPNYRRMKDAAANQHRRSQIELEIRERQDSSGRDFQGRQEIRSRAQEQGGLVEQVSAAKGELIQASAQQKSMEGAREKLLSDHKEGRAASGRKIRDLKSSFRQHTGVGRIWGAVTGQESDNDVDIHNLEKRKELAEAVKEQRGQEAERAREVNALDAENLAISERRGAAAAKLLDGLRAQAGASRRNAESDREEAKAAHRSVGSMSVGDRHILKQIEAKRKAGGTAEQWERDFLRGHAPAGSKVRQWGMDGDEAADNVNVEMFKDPALSEEKAKFDEAQVKKAEPDLQKTIKGESEKQVELGKLIEAHALANKSLQDYFAKAQEGFEKQKQITEEAVAELKRFVK